MNSLFRRQAPSSADLDSFHQDGYIFYPDVLKDEARRSLTVLTKSSPEIMRC